MSQVRGRPFQAGNRMGRGRPKGSRNKTIKAMQELLDQHAESIMRKCIIQAIQGERVAMRLCVERLFPARRDALVQIPLRGSKTLAEVDASFEALLRALVHGEVTPSEAETISNILENRRRVIETAELEERLRRLEQGVEDRGA